MPGLEERQRALQTESKDLEIKLARLKQLDAPLSRWKGRLAEQRFFDGLSDEATQIDHGVRELSAGLELRATIIGDELRNAPSGALVSRLAEEAERLLEALKGKLTEAATVFEGAVRGSLPVQRLNNGDARSRARKRSSSGNGRNSGLRERVRTSTSNISAY